jgi:hypothetical protein
MALPLSYLAYTTVPRLIFRHALAHKLIFLLFVLVSCSIVSTHLPAAVNVPNYAGILVVVSFFVVAGILILLVSLLLMMHILPHAYFTLQTLVLLYLQCTDCLLLFCAVFD